MSEPLPTLAVPALDLGLLEADPSQNGWDRVSPVNLRRVEDGSEPDQFTKLFVAIAGRELRVLFQCEDSHAWATMTGHDEPLFREEVVEVFLDPVGDGECYFEIEVNPLNAVLDGVIRKAPSGLRKDFRWHCDGLRTAVVKHDQGWNAELAIPFESLMPGCAGWETWRVNFTRIDRPLGKSRELSAWSPTGVPLFHVPAKFGFLHWPN